MPENQIKYFWAATLAWPGVSGPVTWSKAASFTTAGTVSRGKVLGDALAMAGAPGGASILFFTVEADEVRR